MAKPLKHVFVCAQSRQPGQATGCCQSHGCDDVLRRFWDELARNACWNEVAITYCGCLGPCEKGTNVLVYPEGVLYGGVVADDVAEIFERHLLGGEPVARLRVADAAW